MNLKQIIDEEKKKIKEEYADMLLEVELPMEYQLTKYIEEHLYYLITQLLEELREEDIDEKITDINYADGYNQRNQILNEKINKILKYKKNEKRLFKKTKGLYVNDRC